MSGTLFWSLQKIQKKINLFSSDATIFFLPTKSWKNNPEKIAPKNSNPLFFLLPWAAQTAQTEEFMFELPRFCLTLFKIFSLWLQLHRVTSYWKKNISPITNLAHFSSMYDSSAKYGKKKRFWWWSLEVARTISYTYT